MGYVPEHWTCDHCDRVTKKENLKPVPANMTCLALNLCPTCREDLGWTNGKIEAAWARFRKTCGWPIREQEHG
jgi:hypothetical protein